LAFTPSERGLVLHVATKTFPSSSPLTCLEWEGIRFSSLMAAFLNIVKSASRLLFSPPWQSFRRSVYPLPAFPFEDNYREFSRFYLLPPSPFLFLALNLFRLSLLQSPDSVSFPSPPDFLDTGFLDNGSHPYGKTPPRSVKPD